MQKTIDLQPSSVGQYEWEGKQMVAKTKAKAANVPAGLVVKLATTLATVAAILGSIALIGTKVIEVQRIFPSLYYGIPQDSCGDQQGFGVALRNGNIPMIRCYIEKEGRSVARPLPNDEPHADHYPLALVAESCNLKAAKYLVLLRGADPRNGHNYVDPNRGPEMQYDTPFDIAFTHCRVPKGVPFDRTHLTREGEAITEFLQKQVQEISPNGR